MFTAESVRVSAPTLVSALAPPSAALRVMSPLPPMVLAEARVMALLSVTAAPLLVSAPSVPPLPPAP